LTIKITQVTTATGEVVLTIVFDNPKDSAQLQTLKLRKQDYVERLLALKNLVGRPLTIADAQDVLLKIVAEARAGLAGIPEDFNFAPYIDVELEA